MQIGLMTNFCSRGSGIFNPMDQDFSVVQVLSMGIPGFPPRGRNLYDEVGVWKLPCRRWIVRGRAEPALVVTALPA